MQYFLIVMRLFCRRCIREGGTKTRLRIGQGAQSYKKWPEMTVMGHGSIGLLRPGFYLILARKPLGGVKKSFTFNDSPLITTLWACTLGCRYIRTSLYLP